MKRLSVALCALVLVLAGCIGTAIGSLVPSVPPVALPSSIPSNLASVAVDALCTDSNPASLASIAGELDKVGADTDTTAIESKLGALVTGLQGMQVSDAAKPIRDAAVTAVIQLQTSIKDPAKRQDAAKKAADAIRAAKPAICK
jgi:hypothetical protein